MAIIHSLKCTVSFSFVVPPVSLVITHYHLLSLIVSLVVPLVVTSCHLLYHSLSLFVIRCHSLLFVVTRYHSLYYSLSLVVPLVVTRCTTRCHFLSFVVTRCHSLSLYVPLACLFINDPCQSSSFFRFSFLF